MEKIEKEIEEFDRGIIHESIMKEFYDPFSSSVFWLDEKYPSNYNRIEKFIRDKISNVITVVIDETEKKVLIDYNKFILEIRKENSSSLLRTRQETLRECLEVVRGMEVKESEIEKIKLMNDFEQKIEMYKMGFNKALNDLESKLLSMSKEK